MFLVICVGLLLLTPKILSLSFDPQGNAFLSGAHSYAAFHNQSACWVCRALPHPQWKASHGGHLHCRERTFFKSVTTFTNNHHMWCFFLIWSHLIILKWTDVTLCTLTGHIITYNFDYTLSWFNDYFAAHKKINGFDGFLPNVYQIWDEVIWLTPEKGCLMSSDPICWEQRVISRS